MKKGSLRNFSLLVFSALTLIACQDAPKPTGGGLPASLGEVPAVRLNYRYEPDVPAPTEAARPIANEQIEPAIRIDFEQNRSQETVQRIIASPNGKRALVAYTRPTDQPEDFRLDMYSSEGVFLRKVSSDLMAVHFPDTISWAPDSSAAAFVAMIRTASVADVTEPTTERPLEPDVVDATGAESNSNTAAVPASPTPAAPVGILLFRTEQLYVTDAEGNGTRPLTQNESLIYYYYEWSPDSTMLATLAATYAEWRYLKAEAERKTEAFVPQGRPRIVEKNGRERLLDDALTAIQPVWSPDSTKIACAFAHQIRVYDSVGTVPTQAAIPLRNNLLISSKAYDTEQARSMGEANAAPQSNEATANTADPSTGERLPDESTLVSFNPIVTIHWPSPELLYFQTAFVKRMLNEADSVSSFPRWHRLIFTPQAKTN
jgi:hypothetical protein